MLLLWLRLMSGWRWAPEELRRGGSKVRLLEELADFLRLAAQQGRVPPPSAVPARLNQPLPNAALALAGDAPELHAANRARLERARDPECEQEAEARPAQPARADRSRAAASGSLRRRLGMWVCGK